MEFLSLQRASGNFQQPLTAAQIRAITTRAFGPAAHIASAHELPGGEYNTIYRIALAGHDPIILRVAPNSAQWVPWHEERLLRRKVQRLGDSAIRLDLRDEGACRRRVDIEQTRQIGIDFEAGGGTVLLVAKDGHRSAVGRPGNIPGAGEFILGEVYQVRMRFVASGRYWLAQRIVSDTAEHGNHEHDGQGDAPDTRGRQP